MGGFGGNVDFRSSCHPCIPHHACSCYCSCILPGCQLCQPKWLRSHVQPGSKYPRSSPSLFLDVCLCFKLPSAHRGIQQTAEQRGQWAVTACQGRNSLSHSVSTSPASSNWGFCLLERLFTRLDFSSESGRKFHCLHIIIWQVWWCVCINLLSEKASAALISKLLLIQVRFLQVAL